MRRRAEVWWCHVTAEVWRHVATEVCCHVTAEVEVRQECRDKAEELRGRRS